MRIKFNLTTLEKSNMVAERVQIHQVIRSVILLLNILLQIRASHASSLGWVAALLRLKGVNESNQTDLVQDFVSNKYPAFLPKVSEIKQLVLGGREWTLAQEKTILTGQQPEHQELEIIKSLNATLQRLKKITQLKTSIDLHKDGIELAPELSRDKLVKIEVLAPNKKAVDHHLPVRQLNRSNEEYKVEAKTRKKKSKVRLSFEETPEITNSQDE